MRAIVESRNFLSLVLSAFLGTALLYRMPFQDQNNLLQLVLLERPYLFYGIKWAYVTMLFSTPYIGFSLVFSLAYIFVVRQRAATVAGKLPPYPPVASRDKLFLVIGELHYPRRPEPAGNPRWLVIPERGLFTGVAIFGAIGSGKTTGCMMPFAEQILAYRAQAPDKRVSGLVLEVKGDFCHKIRKLLEKHHRREDYIEVSLQGKYRYNPLYNDLDAYALAFGIASLLNNLFGRGKEPFWQQAYTNLVKFIILLHKVLYDYVTLFDVYECAINPKLLEQKIEEGDRCFEQQYLLVDIDAFEQHPELDDYGFILDRKEKRLKAPYTEGLLACLDAHGIAHESQTESGGVIKNSDPVHDSDRQQQFEAVKRWFYQDWARIEPKLRTSIIEGISVFLSLFDDNPEVKRVFCPPKAAYDPAANKDGRYGTLLPPFGDLIEQGKVVALNFPASLNPGLARAIGTLMKLDFERAVLNRIPEMERHADRHWREVLFLCDEYQAFRHGWGTRPDRRREVLRALAPGQMHPDCRHTKHQLPPVHFARRELAHAPPDLSHKDLPLPE